MGSFMTKCKGFSSGGPSSPSISSSSISKKWLVVGGFVDSKSDGQRHYVDAIGVMELYGLKRNECERTDNMEIFMSGHNIDSFFGILTVSEGGKYSLPSPGPCHDCQDCGLKYYGLTGEYQCYQPPLAVDSATLADSGFMRNRYNECLGFKKGVEHASSH